jgi:CHAT domain-containing protein
VETLDTAALRRDLGPDTALVEYTSLDGELLAFVVREGGVRVVRGLGTEEEANALLAAFRFQTDALRHGAGGVRRHLASLAERTRRHLAGLYDLLLRPVEAEIEGCARLAVVPHRALHYVPFHALHDGSAYVVEAREVSYSPSATVLRYCLAGGQSAYRSALLLGLSDERIPRVREEVRALAELFPRAVARLDGEATLAALREHAPASDVLHLACHGQFRPDNPLFSSLRLADGWLNVRDAYGLDLRRGGLVTLSACETGMSAVAPGDELMGLVRGFFSAGARSLVLSLWPVDDDATARTMSDFYTYLCAGSRPAAALRSAQLNLLREQPHPFFWSPFILSGRW